jgi:hypothetical protein
MTLSGVRPCTEFMTEDGLVDTRRPGQFFSCWYCLQSIMTGKLVQYSYMGAKCYR